MAPILQSNLKPFTTSNNANAGELYTLSETKTIGGAGKLSLATPIFATLIHAEDNNFLVHNSLRRLHLPAANHVNYKATSGNTMQVCNGACVSVAVVISLGVLLCMSISLFFSLFSRRRRSMNGWWTNYSQRRTSSSVIATIDRRRSFELLRLHHYSENTLPPSSESTVIPATDRSLDLNLRGDDRINDQSDTALTDYVVRTRDASPSPSHIHEILLPPTPRLPVIQLPLVEDTTDIHISPFYPQCNSEEANMSEPSQLEAHCEVSPGPGLDHSNDGTQICPDEHIEGANADPNSNPYSMPMGGLGLIFEGGFSFTSEASVCSNDVNIEGSWFSAQVPA